MASVTQTPATGRPSQQFMFQNISIGCCYYPEHWDRSLWQSDLRRMKEAGIGTVRVAEFAWSTIEAQEGVFDYRFWDDFLDLAEAEDMQVIFGTPTATPPVWLTEKYPECLNGTIDGIKYRHGMRRHYTYNAAKYQELSARITEKIASHFASRRCIIGWQIDNELNCETDVFYSEADTQAFRSFLKARYKDLDSLNRAWGTVVWNQTYGDWNEVYVPRTTVHDSTNPHQMLDYYRFISDSTVRFCKMQADIIRKYKKEGDFITTNGMFSHLDNHRMMDEALDVYCYDSYPNFAFALGTDPRHPKDLNDRMWSRNLALVRSICPHFGIMEQQSGAGGWNTRMEAPAPKPGQVMLWAMQSIAAGADYVSFFRWRTAPFGTEIYWHGILDYDGKDNRKLAEIQACNTRVQRIRSLAGSSYEARLAIVRDYDNDYDCDLDVWHRRLADSDREIFIACSLAHAPMDYLYLLESTTVEELARYGMLFYPHPLMLTERAARLLAQYVEQGGTLIIGARTGLKDEHGHCPMRSMPGPLASLTRTEVTDFSLIGPGDEAETMNWEGQSLPAGIFSDILRPCSDQVQVLARYENNYYRGEPALTLTQRGKGAVLHFGGTFTRENARAFLSYTGMEEPYRKLLSLPAGVELAVRDKDGRKAFFLLNYTAETQELELKDDFTDFDSGETVRGPVRLPAYGTKVYGHP